jgi:flagellin
LDGSLSGNSQVKNLALDESRAVKGKFTTSSAFISIAKGGANTAINLATSLTVQDIGKSINYTVTWQNSAGEIKTTTVGLTFQGDGKGSVIEADNATTKTYISNNYFTDDIGNKYYLQKGTGTLTAASIRDAVMNGLKANTEFIAEFDVSKASVANQDSSAGYKLTFEAKATGSAGARIISTGVSENLSIASINMGGGGNATINAQAVDSMQRFDAAKITVVSKNSSAEDIQEAIFEIDGKKFLAVNATSSGSFTPSQRATIDSDVTMIDISQVTSDGKVDVNLSLNTKKIAAEVTRVTGHEASAVTKTGKNGTIMSSSDITKTSLSDLKNGEIAFTKDKLKLEGTELSLQIGDTNRDYQKVSVKIQDMSSKGLGLKGLDLSNQEAAGKAVDTIQDAINKVSTQRGQLGALQNRLDHTLNNLDATEQNITAAESQIRDVDMAKEMTQYSKNNILVQAAQSMLAQANSLPQGVLSLLQ